MTPTKAKKSGDLRARGPLTPLNLGRKPGSSEETKALSKKLRKMQEKVASVETELASSKAQLKQATDKNTAIQTDLINEKANTDAFENENTRLRNLYNDLQSEGKGSVSLCVAHPPTLAFL